MTVPSARHVPLLLGLVALALLPLLRTRFEVTRLEDCARPAEARELGRVRGSAGPVERFEKYGEEISQWTEVEILGSGEDYKLRGALIRSFTPVELYTRPPRLLLGKFEAGPRHVEYVRSGDEILPIQTIHDTSNGRTAMASYLFVYRGRPVEHPVLAQLLTALPQVWNGTRPLSVLMVAGGVRPEAKAEAQARAQRWLMGAWRHHRDACGP